MLELKTLNSQTVSSNELMANVLADMAHTVGNRNLSESERARESASGIK